jgi:hypothetical protein
VKHYLYLCTALIADCIVLTCVVFTLASVAALAFRMSGGCHG